MALLAAGHQLGARVQGRPMVVAMVSALLLRATMRSQLVHGHRMAAQASHELLRGAVRTAILHLELLQQQDHMMPLRPPSRHLHQEDLTTTMAVIRLMARVLQRLALGLGPELWMLPLLGILLVLPREVTGRS